MEKPAITQHPINELLKKRWSPRAFAAKGVEQDKLASMFEAARWAASSYNEQPWRFIVATKESPSDFQRLLGCLVEANQSWAKAAPVLVITAAKLAFDRNKKPNRVAVHDVALAVANLTVQATDLGLVVHQMAGIDADKTRQSLGIPQGFDPITAIAIGYPGDPQTLADGFREAEMEPRERLLQSQFVFGGAWDKPVAWT